MPTPSENTFAEILRTSPLPPDAAIVLELAAPGRHLETGREVQAVQRGEVPPVRPEFDQINAVLGVLYLRHALHWLGSDNDAGRTVARLAQDLETLVGRDCPALARVLADGRQRDDAYRAHQTAAMLEEWRRDKARMDWLQNAFLGGDSEAGRMIGLPGTWTTLRAEVDRAIEEGR